MVLSGTPTESNLEHSKNGNAMWMDLSQSLPQKIEKTHISSILMHTLYGEPYLNQRPSLYSISFSRCKVQKKCKCKLRKSWWTLKVGHLKIPSENFIYMIHLHPFTNLKPEFPCDDLSNRIHDTHLGAKS